MFLAALPPDNDIVLVAHNNAGLYVPALVQERRVVANVFVDAGLPVRGGLVPLAPPAFRDFLLQKADADGLLPEWTHWWDKTDLEGLCPSAVVRRQVEQEQPRLPLSYSQESLHPRRPTCLCMAPSCLLRAVVRVAQASQEDGPPPVGDGPCRA